MSFDTASWILPLALPPLLSFLLSLSYTLLILSHPPHHRLPAFLVYCALTTHAFLHHQHLSPWFALNDTFARMLYIWAAYVSFAFLIVRVRPVDGEGGEVRGWRGRVRWAGKVLFTRRLGRYYPRWRVEGEAGIVGMGVDCADVREGETRLGLTRMGFLFHHASRALLYFTVNWAWETYIAPLSTPSLSSPTDTRQLQPPFLRHIPAALTTPELTSRALMTWDTCISDALFFSTLYHVFALLWVLVLRLGVPQEWDPSLFGSPADCYSVRRYWGVYWHDYIGASFSGHVKLVTRRVLGLGRGCVRRVVENAGVFVASGVAHEVVRYVQTGGEGVVGAVGLWYAGQMGPIVVEGTVQWMWMGSGARAMVREWVREEVLVRIEKVVGYFWVFGWMFWSVPTYLLTREAWEMDRLRRRYPELFDRVHESVTIAAD